MPRDVGLPSIAFMCAVFLMLAIVMPDGLAPALTIFLFAAIVGAMSALALAAFPASAAFG
jgi:hypothetical protein